MDAQYVGIVLAIVGLTITVVANIFLMARWSGRVDEQLQVIMNQPARWTSDLNATASSIRSEVDTKTAVTKSEVFRISEEVEKLRKARHEADGTIQRHEGAIGVQGRVLDRLLEALHIERQDGLNR